MQSSKNELTTPLNSHKSGGGFIVFEGIDGCGGETQSKKLAQYLRKKGKVAPLLSYPDYKGPIGKLIHSYLYRRHNFSKEVQLLLYFADFLKDKDKIQKWLQEGKTIVSDRYFSSTIAYQCLNGFTVEKALQMSKLFALPVPDVIIYLDITSETSIKRKIKEKKGNLDRHEADKKFLSDLAKFYKQLIRKQVFAKWMVVNGEQSVEKVAKDIQQILTTNL